MTITTLDALVAAMGNNSSRIMIDKSSINNTAAGSFCSFWRATGQPGQGATPTAAAVCNDATTGGMPFTQQTAPSTTYATYLYMTGSNVNVSMELHDRLMHMGGLSGASTSSQNVNLDLNANLANSNLSARKGDANFSDVQWWMEWYADTGGTASTATIGVTYNDGSTGTLTVALAATRRSSLMIPLNGYIPAAAAGKYIRGIDTMQLSASTTVAGNIGFTCTRPRTVMPLPVANKMEIFDWAALGLPEIHNNSCLQLIQLASATSSGTIRGGGKISHG